ncbi:MAG: Asp-tRNA(Asn)/Glu-tRNA(Gln) amidotransferase subunit GatB [Limnochordaceae bacterium]|nr:Asp-tRNA(Asn)/Glu-tRNA(Gln) amidotransferase subunit GatB [Limnochordaceae bacterium]
MPAQATAQAQAAPSVPPGWEAVIGLEIHVELATESKIYCGCSTRFGAPPNTQVCPVCLGLPGSLPVLNEKAVEYAVRAGLALHCRIAPYAKFDRKNYFYPDLPKAYQISQYDLPLCRDGYLEVEVGGRTRRVGIIRVHLEEETGKLVHSTATIAGSRYSLVDYNRSGVPLIEIVTQPDLRTPEEARLFLEELRSVMQYLGVSDVKMEEGSLRCDANISLRRPGETRLGTKTEVKNINSLRAVERALRYEAYRQAAVLEDGGRIVQETRGWDEASGTTIPMRSKETVQDYRYFPEPDIPPLALDEAYVERVRQSLPELPAARRRRLMEQWQLPAYDAWVICQHPALAGFFEQAASRWKDGKTVSNWVMGEVLRILGASGEEPGVLAGRPEWVEHLVEVLRLVSAGRISANVGKEVLEESFKSGRAPEEIVRARGLEQVGDEAQLLAWVRQAIEANPDAVASYRAGKAQAAGFLVGQVMKLSKGKANPKTVGELMRRELGEPGTSSS